MIDSDEGEILIEIFIRENMFENVICEMAAILSRLQCVNYYKSVKIKYKTDVPRVF